jgi:hypothetical protein
LTRWFHTGTFETMTMFADVQMLTNIHRLGE